MLLLHVHVCMCFGSCKEDVRRPTPTTKWPPRKAHPTLPHRPHPAPILPEMG